MSFRDNGPGVSFEFNFSQECYREDNYLVEVIYPETLDGP
jgi:hypothetical protein